MELFTAVAEHAATSDHRMGPPTLWRGRRSAEQRLADLESSLVQVKLDPAEHAALLAPLLDIPLATLGEAL
jgi:hypothetical protein